MEIGQLTRSFNTMAKELRKKPLQKLMNRETVLKLTYE